MASGIGFACERRVTMIHTFIVTVKTDDNHIDAPTSEQIQNEIQSNLEFDAPGNGILSVGVHVPVKPLPFVQNYRESVIGSYEQ